MARPDSPAFAWQTKRDEALLTADADLNYEELERVVSSTLVGSATDTHCLSRSSPRP